MMQEFAELSGSKLYTVTLRLNYGRLIIEDIEASNEQQAIDKAYRIAEDDLWTSKVDQVEWTTL